METASAATGERCRAAWHEHKDPLWRALLAWSGQPDVASEALAEAFAQALRRGEAIDDVGRWVWRAAFRIGAGLLADRRRDRARRADLVDAPASDALPEEVVALLDLLDRVPATDRRVLALSVVGGWSAVEIARLTDSTSGAVRVRLHRARRRLQRDLEERDG